MLYSFSDVASLILLKKGLFRLESTILVRFLKSAAAAAALILLSFYGLVTFLEFEEDVDTGDYYSILISPSKSS